MCHSTSVSSSIPALGFPLVFITSWRHVMYSFDVCIPHEDRGQTVFVTSLPRGCPVNTTWGKGGGCGSHSRMDRAHLAGLRVSFASSMKTFLTDAFPSSSHHAELTGPILAPLWVLEVLLLWLLETYVQILTLSLPVRFPEDGFPVTFTQARSWHIVRPQSVFLPQTCSFGLH